MELVWITLASGLAGFVDSIVGGGGLILLPALLVAYPSAPAAAMFYDGFFGPGTGSLMVFALVRWLGYDFLHASAGAKLMNMSSNAAALLLLSFNGLVWWHLALPLALANIVGSVLGTRMALRHGSGFVRWMFIGVVGVLILKTSWNAYSG
ncbi:MAG: hypothetical protein EB072_04310 [Betaproteobacteria bacterium]|nr:hypothetical protein [Betaproteobacteria bacterium]